jgi:hypothetical protein
MATRYKPGPALALVWALVLGAVLVTNTFAVTAESTSLSDAKTSSANKEKKDGANSGQVTKGKTFRDTAESKAERSARLKRECRGAVKAGACTGYTD